MIQQNRTHPDFPREKSVLQRYPNFNDLCEALYLNSQPNEQAHRDFESIHHLKERISWYLTPDIIDDIIKQTTAVIITENVSKDFQMLTRTKTKLGHEKNIGNSMNRQLSDVGMRNLERIIAEDYEILAKLTRAKNQ